MKKPEKTIKSPGAIYVYRRKTPPECNMSRSLVKLLNSSASKLNTKQDGRSAMKNKMAAVCAQTRKRETAGDTMSSPCVYSKLDTNSAK